MLTIFGFLETFLSELRLKNAERHKNIRKPMPFKDRGELKRGIEFPLPRWRYTYQPDGLLLVQTGSQLNSPNAFQFKNNDVLHNG